MLKIIVCPAFSSRIRTHSLHALSCQTASQSINIFFVIIIKSTCSDTKTEGAGTRLFAVNVTLFIFGALVKEL